MNPRKLRRYVAENFASEPVWQIIVNRCDWLCPYCGEIGARGLSADSEVEVLLMEHLSNVCGQWRQGEGKQLPMDRLKKRRKSFEFHFKIQRLLRKDPRFRLKDGERWVCPYCAGPTDVGVPEDRKHYGIESPFLNGVIAHLIPCQRFDSGRGQPQSYEELRSRYSPDGSESQEGDEMERFGAKLASAPLFRLLDVERGWLCPHCGRDSGIQFLPGGKVDERIVDAAWKHVRVCREEHKMPDLETLKGRLQEINRTKLMAQVRRKLEGHAVWQVLDLDNIWYCPYCARATDVQFPVGLEPDSRLVLKVLRHVLACSTQARARIKGQPEIEAAAASQNERIRVRNDLKPRIRNSDSYSYFHVETGFWICPHCIRPVEEMAFHAGDELTREVLDRLVDHLLSCARYLDDPNLIASVHELRTRFGPRNQDSGELAFPPELDDSEEDDDDDLGDISSGELIFYSEDDEEGAY